MESTILETWYVSLVGCVFSVESVELMFDRPRLYSVEALEGC
jgi:hypothetical protein